MEDTSGIDELRRQLDDCKQENHALRAELDIARSALMAIRGGAIDLLPALDASDQSRHHDTFFYLIESNPFGVYVIDSDFRLRQVSAGAQKVFKTVRPLLGRDFAEVLRTIWPEPFAGEAIARFRHTLDTGEPYVASSTVERRRDIDDVEAYDWRIERITLPDGRFGVICYFYDLSERQRLEEALRASEAALGTREKELHSITDNVPNIIARFDRDLRHVFVNKAVEKATGLQPSAFLGKTNRELWMPADKCDLWDAAMRNVFETGRGHTLRFYFIAPDGDRRYQAEITPEFDANGTVEHILVVTRDVTADSQAADSLALAKEEAEAANAAKDRFLATLSHELRTPLAPVRMALSHWERQPDGLPAELLADLGMIRRNIDLECRLIDDMLDLNRIAGGKLELQFATIDLHEELRHALTTVAEEASVKQIVLSMDLDAQSSRVVADGARLQQVFWNLLKNAVKFTPPFGVVAVRTSNAPNGCVRVEVRDTGTGIDPDLLQSIFNAFEQGGIEVTRQFGGLGLGLAISKAIVDMHGGNLTAHSEGKGRGAVFSLDLGVAAPTEPGAADRFRGTEAATTNTPRTEQSLRILLVEDHVDTARIMKRLLGSLGYDVKTAGSVKEALAASESRAFDLLISDLGLPDGTGYDVMREVRKRCSIRGIAVSGYGMQDDLRRGEEAGFSAHLTKPINLEQLEVTIRRIMRDQFVRAPQQGLSAIDE